MAQREAEIAQREAALGSEWVHRTELDTDIDALLLDTT